MISLLYGPSGLHGFVHQMAAYPLRYSKGQEQSLLSALLDQILEIGDGLHVL